MKVKVLGDMGLSKSARLQMTWLPCCYVRPSILQVTIHATIRLEGSISRSLRNYNGTGAIRRIHQTSALLQGFRRSNPRVARVWEDLRAGV